MIFEPEFMATGIGSMPFTDVNEAVNISLTRLTDAPFWPQLPGIGLNEQMEIQYSEGMPRIVIDREKRRMYFDTTGDYSEDLAEFYEAYILAMDPDDGNGDCSALSLGPEFTHGLYALEERLQEEGRKYPFIKVQTTGPCSFCLTITDENKRAIFYNEEFRDVVVKALAMKCRWQIQRFAQYAERIICFIDEPILSAFGSSTYVSVQREDVVSLISEVVDAVHQDGALAGIHCCGNTEWSILMDAGADIVNLDAFEYGETISMYPDTVKAFLERGGMIAWGIVPTSMDISTATVESLSQRLEKNIDLLASKGIDRSLITRRSIITPACGTGCMASVDAERVFELTQALSVSMKERYGY